MRKVGLIVVAAILFFLAFFVMYNGVHIGGLDIASVRQLGESKLALEQVIEGTKEKINEIYPETRSELEEKQGILLKNKNEYIQLANLSSESDIAAANVDQSYSLEYLWVKVGNYATAEGITLKLEVVENEEGSKDLNFTAQGAYLGIIRFISSIENDTDLNFRIQDFEMVSTGINKDGTAKLKATFAVKYLDINLDRIIPVEEEEKTEDTTPTEEEVSELFEKGREQQNRVKQEQEANAE